jgi:ectoine hydroxylase-related dioxygenase (phytanoyl-CoA dioxygenase family)
MGQPAAIANASRPPEPTLGSAWLAERPWIDDPNEPIEPRIAHLPPEAAAEMCALLHTWRDNGVIILKGVAPPELIDALLRDIETLKADPRRFHVEINHRSRRFFSDDLSEPLSLADFNDQFFRLCQIHWLSRAAARLALIPEIVRFISIVFQAPAVLMQSLTFLKSSQQPTHIDYPYVRAQRKLAFMLASWIPLEDVHPDAGPLVYYPGGHRPEVSGFFEWAPGEILMDEGATKTPNDFAGYLDHRMKALGIAPATYLPRKGDVLLWHGNLPHSGSAVRNTALTRRSLVTHYTSEDGVPPRWDLSYDDPARVIVDNGLGKSWEPAGAPVSKLPSWYA